MATQTVERRLAVPAAQPHPDEGAPLDILMAVTRSDAIGGAPVCVRNLARQLIERGHSVTVLIGGSGPMIAEFRRSGIPVESIAELGGAPHPLNDLRTLRRMVAILRSRRPDVVVGHTAKAGLLTRLAARALFVPVLYTAHGWSFNGKVAPWQAPFYRAVERLASRLDAPIVSVCESDRALALEVAIGAPQQHVVVPNGVPDQTRGRRAEVSRTPARIVSVTRFEIPKDPLTLLRAFATVGGDHVLELIGDGPDRIQAEQLAAELGIADRVDFSGVRDDVPDRLLGSQVFALSSWSEGLPLSVLEAMAAGLPVVASAVGGIPEAVDDERTGLLFAPGDVDGLAARLQQLLADPPARVRMGTAGRRRYEAEFTDVEMARRLEALYRSHVQHAAAQPTRRRARFRRRQQAVPARAR